MPTPIAEYKDQILEGSERFLIYGDPGMGKTFTALTVPEPIYFLSCGGSNELKTYYSKDFQDKHGKKEIFVDVAKESYDKGRVSGAVGFSQVEEMVDTALEMDARGEMEFASIVIDNATRVIDFQLNRCMEISYMGAKADAKDKTAFHKYSEHGIFTPQDTDWGAAQSIMRKWQSWFLEVEKNFVFVAHEHKETAKVDRHNTVVIGHAPLFIGQDRDRISNYFDNVWRMYRVGETGSGGQKYAARTVASSNPTVVAKTRLGGIVSRDYQDPDLSKTIKKFLKHTGSV